MDEKKLGPPSSSEPLIDVSSVSLLKFHFEESIAQKKILIQNPSERSSVSDLTSTNGQLFGTVDLILAVEQQDEACNLSSGDLSDAQSYLFSPYMSLQCDKSLSYLVDNGR
jgi:hypothetical protein